MALAGLKKAAAAAGSKKYNLIILDEINIALKLKLVALKDVLKVIANTPRKTELVLTGRSAPAAIIKKADLVSHLREVKHYYLQGVKARRGIEF